jgi:hypothetical protein
MHNCSKLQDKLKPCSIWSSKKKNFLPTYPILKSHVTGNTHIFFFWPHLTEQSHFLHMEKNSTYFGTRSQNICCRIIWYLWTKNKYYSVLQMHVYQFRLLLSYWEYIFQWFFFKQQAHGPYLSPKLTWFALHFLLWPQHTTQINDFYKLESAFPYCGPIRPSKALILTNSILH